MLVRFSELLVRKRWIPLAVALALLVTLGPVARPASAQVSPASDLISALNQLRAENGLPALETNSALMSIAQAHSNYQASIGSVTHTGAGDTRPWDRANTAGYGDGSPIYISENVAGGINLTVAEAVSQWQSDEPHLNTMLGASYEDIGAGIAVSGNFVYYTLDVAYVADRTGGSGSSPPSGEGDSPVQVANQLPDGSVIHEVQPGQTLIGIAVAYGITVEELQTLNELGTNTFIYPGDKLLVKLAYTPTPTPSPTVTPTPPRPTRRPPPTSTATPNAALAAASTADSSRDPTPGSTSIVRSLVVDIEGQTDRGGLILGILGVAFILLISPVILGILRKK